MSNEPINRILKENNLEFISFAYPNMYPRIRKAMGQICKEGRKEGVTAVGVGYHKDLTRLRELVKAQKELIGLHEKLAETDFITSKEWDRMDELRNRIKKLES